MSDVLDVITRLTYNVDGGNEVKQMSIQLEKQIADIDKLTLANAKLNAQLNKVGKEDLTTRKKINTEIANNTKQIETLTAAIGKEIAANETLQGQISKQIGLINSLTLQEQNLLRLRSQTNDEAEIQSYNNQLLVTQNRLRALYSAGVTGAKQFNQLQFASTQILREIPAFAFSAQTGILAISNNIPILLDQLSAARASGQSTGTIVKSLGASIFSLNGILTLSVAALAIFGDKLFDTADATKAAREEVEKYKDAIKGIREAGINRANEQINNEKTLVAIIKDATTTEKQRAAAVQELRKAYPALLKDVAKDAKSIPTDKLEKFTQEVEKQIDAKEKSKSNSEELIKVQERLRKQEDLAADAVTKHSVAQRKLNQLEEAYKSSVSTASTGGIVATPALDRARKEAADAEQRLKALNRNVSALQGQEQQLRQDIVANRLNAPDLEQFEKDGGDVDELYRKAKKNLEDALSAQVANDEILSRLLTQEQDLNTKYKALYDNDLSSGITLSAEDRKIREGNYSEEERRVNYIRDLRNNELNQQLTRAQIELNKAFNKANEVLRLERELKELQTKSTEIRLGYSQGAQGIGRLNNQGAGIQDRQFKTIPDAIVKQKGEDALDAMFPNKKKLDERVKQQIEAYQTVAHAAAQAYNAIANAQLASQDAQIAAQQRRVEQATELYKQGNTEVLKIEKERLEASIKERERIARRQQIINAALTVSESVLAIATAAGESGAGAVVIVPAVIAAIAAGYAAVSALSQENQQGFKDGVVDYQGKGTEKSDSNTVKISKGESVITAEATKKYKAELEQMNAGTYRMVQIPKQVVAYHSNQSNVDMKGVERGLKEVREAVANNAVKVQQIMDANGLTQVVETIARRDNGRFK